MANKDNGFIGFLKVCAVALSIAAATLCSVVAMRSIRFHMPHYRRPYGGWSYRPNYITALLKIVIGSAIVGAVFGIIYSFFDGIWHPSVSYFDDAGKFIYTPGKYEAYEATHETPLMIVNAMDMIIAVFALQLYRWAQSLFLLRNVSHVAPGQFKPETKWDAMLLGYRDLEDFNTYYKQWQETADKSTFTQAYHKRLQNCPTWFARDIMWEGIAVEGYKDRFSTADIEDNPEKEAIDILFLLRNVFGFPFDPFALVQAIKNRDTAWLHYNGLMMDPLPFRDYGSKTTKVLKFLRLPLDSGDLSVVMGQHTGSKTFAWEVEMYVMRFLAGTKTMPTLTGGRNYANYRSNSVLVAPGGTDNSYRAEPTEVEIDEIIANLPLKDKAIYESATDEEKAELRLYLARQRS